MDKPSIIDMWLHGTISEHEALFALECLGVQDPDGALKDARSQVSP